MTTRLSINMNDQTTADLKELAARRQTFVTEIVRRAVSVYKFIEDECVQGDKTLKVVHPDGRESIVTIL